jgi:predicted XRE-type DNA-binding protein
MMKFNIEINQDNLTESQVAEVLEIVASAIRNEEMTELMDGSHQIQTTYGQVWLTLEEEEEN